MFNIYKLIWYCNVIMIIVLVNLYFILSQIKVGGAIITLNKAIIIVAVKYCISIPLL